MKKCILRYSMGEIRKNADVRLFAGIMWRPEGDWRSALEALALSYGDVDAAYGPIEFSWSDYYAEEMGEGLLKYYVVFREPIDRGRLPTIKIHTNELERQFSLDGKRAVNIDPGYLAVDKFVLASTKDFYHRLYLSDGIFGEVTLHYRKSGRRSGGFRFFSWTYPDYREPEFFKFLEAARSPLL